MTRRLATLRGGFAGVPTRRGARASGKRRCACALRGLYTTSPPTCPTPPPPPPDGSRHHYRRPPRALRAPVRSWTVGGGAGRRVPTFKHGHAPCARRLLRMTRGQPTRRCRRYARSASPQFYSASLCPYRSTYCKRLPFIPFCMLYRRHMPLAAAARATCTAPLLRACLAPRRHLHPAHTPRATLPRTPPDLPRRAGAAVRPASG